MRQLPYSKKQGIVFCRFNNMDNTPFSGCPRFRLESARTELKAIGLELRVGFELDFSIFRN